MSPHERRSNEYEKARAREFLGRRKNDPKPVRFPEPRRFFERGPVIVCVILLAAVVALARWGGLF